MGKTQVSKTSNKQDPTVSAAQQGQVGATLPVLQQLMQQIMTSLQTGTTQQIPMVQRSVEAGRNATANASQQTGEMLARAGVTGPYARSVQEGVDQQGAFDVSQIDPKIMQQLLFQTAPDLALMRGSPVFGGASGTSTTKGTGGGSGDIASAIASMASIAAMFA